MELAHRTHLVTGAAGFIGSHLAEALLAAGGSVVGVDCFSPYYPRAVKEANLSRLLGVPGFRFVQADLLEADPEVLVGDIGTVYHLAGQPGVRPSWGADFDSYARANVMATQRLLEIFAGRPLKRFVYASSSSVYGDAVRLPVSESELPRPLSPYGVTKLAAEHLCHLYGAAHGIPVVALRYFTVYGPRQRPDMAFHRFISAALGGEEISVNGDGGQTRDFTFVADAVRATILAGNSPAAVGGTYNVAGGSRASVNEVLETLQGLVGGELTVKRGAAQVGDARHTWADTAAAERDLGFRPQVRLESGLRAQTGAIRADLMAVPK